jgi:hypothetical protein
MKAWLATVVSSIGVAAWRTCSQSQTAAVMGVTSRGVFICPAPERVVFVSLEVYRSPLTITLAGGLDRLRSLEVNASAQLSDNRLIFPSIETSISLSADAVWHCPPPSSVLQPRIEQRQTLRAIAREVLTRRGNTGLAILLSRLLELPDASPLSAEHVALLDRLIAVRDAVRSGDDQYLIADLMSLLGQGHGLTPSGDDVAVGLLLMLNRWHADHDWAVVNRAVLEAAYRVTTTISANLIECATAGQGDERLITVVDGIATGSASIDDCVECVLSWGSSSGIDALVGMSVAV